MPIDDHLQRLSQQLYRDPFEIRRFEALALSATSYNDYHSSNEDKLELVKNCFKPLLSRYPSLSKYWESLATQYLRNGGKNVFLKEFHHALNSLPYDVGLWTSYLTYRLQLISDDAIEILDAFEKARHRIGRLYYSAHLYELYIDFLSLCWLEIPHFEEKSYAMLSTVLSIPQYSSSSILKRLISNNKRTTLSSYKFESSELYRLYEYLSFANVELYEFERDLESPLIYSGSESHDIERWRQYSEFAILNHDHDYTIQFFERCLVATAFFPDFVITFASYCCLIQKLNKARSILKRALGTSSSCVDARYIATLSKLELYAGNPRKARDYLVQYIRCNKYVSRTVALMLNNIEKLFLDYCSETKTRSSG